MNNYLTNYYSRKKAHLIESKTEEWYDLKKFNLSDLQQYILSLQNDGWEEIAFDHDCDTKYIEVSFRKTREETDEEYNKRMKILDRLKNNKKKKKERAKLNNEEQERKEYERLKKKFEK